MISRLRGFVLVVTFVLAAASASAAPITITFDSLLEYDDLSSLIPGLTFTNAMVLTAGTSLNELDFPPRSGSNVAYDNGGPMTISFAQQVYSLSGYFTYTTPVILTAYDSSNNVLGSILSVLTSNNVSSSTPSPNELMAFTSLTGISSVTFAGDASGGSFVLDDFTYDNEVASVPEPGTLSLLLLAGGMALVARRRKAAGKPTEPR